MQGHRRWVGLIVAAVVAVGVMGVLATQLELSRAKEKPCGTALRIDLRWPTVLRQRASDLEGADDSVMRPDAGRLAAELRAEAQTLEDRCKTRQELALLGLGAGGVGAASAVAWSTYRLGRRAGRSEGRSPPLG